MLVKDRVEYKGLYIMKQDDVFIVVNETSNILGKADNLLQAKFLIDFIKD